MKKNILILLFLFIASVSYSQQIPDLDAIDASATGDLLYCVDVSGTTDRAEGTGKKCTVSQLNTAINSDISGTTAITAAGGITVTNKTIRVVGDGGAIDITANPQIVAGDYDGQIVIIQGTHDTNTVKIDDGTGVGLCNGTSMTLGVNDNLSLIYNTSASEWQEWGGRCDLN